MPSDWSFHASWPVTDFQINEGDVARSCGPNQPQAKRSRSMAEAWGRSWRRALEQTGRGVARYKAPNLITSDLTGAATEANADIESTTDCSDTINDSDTESSTCHAVFVRSCNPSRKLHNSPSA